MEYQVVENAHNPYIEFQAGSGRIESERDALDLIGIAGEHQIYRLLLHADNLAEDFYHLHTGLAGAVLQKLAQYGVKTAAVLTPERVNQGRFAEMVLEANRSNRAFHVFYDHAQAVEWLVRE